MLICVHYNKSLIESHAASISARGGGGVSSGGGDGGGLSVRGGGLAGTGERLRANRASRVSLGESVKRTRAFGLLRPWPRFSELLSGDVGGDACCDCLLAAARASRVLATSLCKRRIVAIFSDTSAGSTRAFGSRGSSGDESGGDGGGDGITSAPRPNSGSVLRLLTLRRGLAGLPLRSAGTAGGTGSRGNLGAAGSLGGATGSLDGGGETGGGELPTLGAERLLLMAPPLLSPSASTSVQKRNTKKKKKSQAQRGANNADHSAEIRARKCKPTRASIVSPSLRATFFF